MSFLYIFQVSQPSDEAGCSLVTVSEAKQTQRKAGRAARKALGPEERKAANAALCAFLWQLAAVQNAQTILLYARRLVPKPTFLPLRKKPQAQRQNAGLSGVRRGVFPYSRCARRLRASAQVSADAAPGPADAPPPTGR